MSEKPLSQIESRLVADWLKRERNVNVGNSFLFWRKRPAIAAEWVRAEWQVKVTAAEIEKAAGRDEVR